MDNVEITPRELYDKLMEVSNKITELAVAVSPIPARFDDHETRLRALEKKIWAAAGFAAAIGTGLGTALSQIFGG